MQSTMQTVNTTILDFQVIVFWLTSTLGQELRKGSREWFWLKVACAVAVIWWLWLDRGSDEADGS